MYCLLKAVGISSNNDFVIGYFSSTDFSVLDIKNLMIAANLTLGDVTWLLFELVLIVLSARNDKTDVTYIEVVLYKPPL